MAPLEATSQPSGLGPRWIVVAEHFASRLLTLHRREFEIAARKTAFGDEALTELITVGAYVRPGDVLIGRRSPRNDALLSPEEKLLRAINAEPPPETRDSSMRAPPGLEAQVVESSFIAAEKGEVARARVVVAWERPLSVGDELELEDHTPVIVVEIRPLSTDVRYDGPTSLRLSKVRSALDVIHARSIGPYSLVTSQPLGGREQFGGQQVTEEQARALVAGGGRWLLAELFTIKSDDVLGRTRAYESLVLGKNPAPYPASEPAAVEGAQVLKAEVAALGFDLDWSTGKLELRWLADAGTAARSRGQVKKPETINYRTYAPEEGGLFCSRIFGPIRDYACACGKYQGMKHRGVLCERCGVEVIQSKVRRERFGHVVLAAPVLHPWFVEHAALLLERSEDQVLELQRDRKLEAALTAISLDAIEAATTGPRAELAERLLERGIGPVDLLLHDLPVLPPDLRPLVPLDGGRFAVSDLNDLYRRVINRSNRLARLLELNAPEIIVQNEIGELFDAVAALFANGRKGAPKVTGPDDRRLVSLLGMIEGRLTGGLVSKRVDYSAVAMLVVDPRLAPSECRVPERITRELFRPMAYERMEREGRVTTIKSAKAALEQQTDWALRAIDEASRGWPVLLMAGARMVSRRIQLWDQPAIAVDPETAKVLDQAEVVLHVPLTAEARAECERFDPPSSAPPRQLSGWFARLMAGDDPLPCLVQAMLRGEVDPLDDLVLRLALGLPPSLH